MDFSNVLLDLQQLMLNRTSAVNLQTHVVVVALAASRYARNVYPSAVLLGW